MELASWFHTFWHFFSASLIWFFSWNHRATKKSTQPGSPIGTKTMIWTWRDRLEGRETHFKLLKMPQVTMIPSKSLKLFWGPRGTIRFIDHWICVIGHIMIYFLAGNPPFPENHNYWIFRQHWQAWHPAEFPLLKRHDFCWGQGRSKRARDRAGLVEVGLVTCAWRCGGCEGCECWKWPLWLRSFCEKLKNLNLELKFEN